MDIDSLMVDAIDDIAAWLTAEAVKTGDLVEQNDLAQTNARIGSARRQIRPLRDRVSQAMIDIRRLEGEFIEVSAAV